MHWNWRLRSPNSGNANNVRNVNTDGSENNNNAYNGNVGVLPLRWIYRDRVARAAKAEPIIKGKPILSNGRRINT